MKQYALFAGDNYYPMGGMGDFVGSFNTIEEALIAIDGKDWWHVIDTDTWNAVRKSD